MRALFQPRPKTPQFRADPIRPDTPIAAIGDVHGHTDLLLKLWDELARVAPDARIVHLGDMIDRGPDSAGVLRAISARPDCVNLMGNHEAMLLQFLDSPETAGPRWLAHGGIETLESFGFHDARDTEGPDALCALRDALIKVIGLDGVHWCAALPTHWQSGNVVFVHAGLDPAQPIAAQDQLNLIWGHAAFRKTPRTDGLWVVHGHTVVTSPRLRDGVISIDTGAHRTGRLSAAVIRPDTIDFVTVSAD